MDKETLRLIGSICELVFDYVNAKQADLGIKDSMHEYYKELQDEIERLHDADDEDEPEDDGFKDLYNQLVEMADKALEEEEFKDFNEELMKVLDDDKAEFHDNKRPVNCICKRAIKKARTSSDRA